MSSLERPLRIAMVAACPLPARRGTPLRVERLAQALHARGHDIELITYHLAEEDGQFGFPVRRIFDRRDPGTLAPGPTLAKLALYDPALALLIRRRLRARPFDVLHAHHFEGLLTASFGRRGSDVPLVYDAHTMLDAELPAYGKSWVRQAARRVGQRLDRWIPSLADRMVVVTRSIRDQLVDQHGFDPRQIAVVPNGVEADAFVEGTRTVTPDRDLLLYSGTLAPYQGIDLMLHAFAAALEIRPGLRLRLLVSSSFEPFAPMARSLGIAHAIEVVQESFDLLPRRLAEGAIALLPRVDCPGLPQKLLNYMASGRAIVAFAGSAKVLTHEVNGLIVPNHDIPGFAAAIVRLVDDPELGARLGQAARTYVLATSTWDRTAERCERVYASLLGLEPMPSGEFQPDQLLPMPNAAPHGTGHGTLTTVP